MAVARHSESLEPLVVYRPLHNRSGLWVRPYAMFFEQVERNGRREPRFAFIGECAVDAASSTPSENEITGALCRGGEAIKTRNR